MNFQDVKSGVYLHDLQMGSYQWVKSSTLSNSKYVDLTKKLGSEIAKKVIGISKSLQDPTIKSNITFTVSLGLKDVLESSDATFKWQKEHFVEIYLPSNQSAFVESIAETALHAFQDIMEGFKEFSSEVEHCVYGVVEPSSTDSSCSIVFTIWQETHPRDQIESPRETLQTIFYTSLILAFGLWRLKLFH